MRFSQKRFVDIGQTLFLNWLQKISAPSDVTEEDMRQEFSKAAKMAFMAAEEFALVFDGQEKNND
jgi:hypothetical protein